MTKVYLSGSVGNRAVYHTEKDCRALKKANTVRYEPQSRYPELDECEICKNGGKTGGKGDSEKKTCNLCEETFKSVPNHIRNCPERSQSPITSDD